MRKYRLVETDTGEEIEADSDTVERVAGVSAKYLA